MSLKDKIFNKVADFVNKYKTPDYDRITNATISGFVKGAIVTSDCTYIKPIEEKTQKGMISIDKLLENELGNNKYNTITFCEEGNVVCINNKSKNSYIETVHECFDLAQENVYVVCESKNSFETFRDFVNQSSKYHLFLEDAETIPQKEAFDNLFNVKKNENNDITKIFEEKEEQEIDLNKNYVQLDGKVTKIGKEFTKKDGVKARFIDVEQNYEYKGKIKKNIISVMLEGDVFNEYGNQINVGDKIGLTGTFSTYTDRNKQTQSVINSFDLEILNRNQNREAERV